METILKFEQQNWKESISLKLVIVMILSLLLLIPSQMVRSLINEREIRKNETMSEISGKWGTNQTLNGPVLVIPYVKPDITSSEKQNKIIGYFQMMPTTLLIDSKIDAEPKKTGNL